MSALGLLRSSVLVAIVLAVTVIVDAEEKPEPAEAYIPDEWVSEDSYLRLGLSEQKTEIRRGMNLLEFAKQQDPQNAGYLVARLNLWNGKPAWEMLDRFPNSRPPVKKPNFAFYFIFTRFARAGAELLYVALRSVLHSGTEADVVVIVCARSPRFFLHTLKVMGARLLYVYDCASHEEYRSVDWREGWHEHHGFVEAFFHEDLLQYDKFIVIGPDNMVVQNPDLYFDLPEFTAVGDSSGPLNCDFYVRDSNRESFNLASVLFMEEKRSPFTGWNREPFFDHPPPWNNIVPYAWATCQGFFHWYYTYVAQNFQPFPPNYPMPFCPHALGGNAWVNGSLADIRLVQFNGEWKPLRKTLRSQSPDSSHWHTGMYPSLDRLEVFWKLHAHWEALHDSVNAALKHHQIPQNEAEFLEFVKKMNEHNTDASTVAIEWARFSPPALDLASLPSECTDCVCCCGLYGTEKCFPSKPAVRAVYNHPEDLAGTRLLLEYDAAVPRGAHAVVRVEAHYECSHAQELLSDVTRGVRSPLEIALAIPFRDLKHCRLRLRAKNRVGWGEYCDWVPMHLWKP